MNIGSHNQEPDDLCLDVPVHEDSPFDPYCEMTEADWQAFLQEQDRVFEDIFESDIYDDVDLVGASP